MLTLKITHQKQLPAELQKKKKKWLHDLIKNLFKLQIVYRLLLLLFLNNLLGSYFFV